MKLKEVKLSSAQLTTASHNSDHETYGDIVSTQYVYSRNSGRGAGVYRQEIRGALCDSVSGEFGFDLIFFF